MGLLLSKFLMLPRVSAAAKRSPLLLRPHFLVGHPICSTPSTWSSAGEKPLEESHEERHGEDEHPKSPTYGDIQENPFEAASRTLSESERPLTNDDDEKESLENTGFDISKRTRPSGEE